ncbi:porin [Achromobacter seleniivolatilans]|uniref:Porin n=1 Tax=Achromobacter seleniivolatilans TaxID=3047478 RepID=A0ABY9M0U4_9BURK|nr:porin [Achromobacter sp. R39]WMD20350.1 porin [Achromobacter sp. R39]
MKKKIALAALALGAAGPACAAETSVTLYGLLDMGLGYERVRAPDFKQTRIGTVQGVNSGSRFGLRGVEDLGDGLQALFTLEGGITPLNGKSAQSGRLFGRQATLGLADDAWGQLEFGRQANLASKYFSGPVDPFSGSFNLANMGTTFSATNTLRYDNLALYQSPVWSGFQFGLGYSFNADDTRTDTNGQKTGFATGNNNRAITAGARYLNGPVTLVASYDRFNPTNDAQGGKSSARIQEWIVGGAYDFEVLKVGAAFGQTRGGWLQGASMGVSPDTQYRNASTFALAQGFRANSYQLNATVPLGKSKLMASWQRADPNGDKLTGDDASINIYSAAYTYDFTKRTNLYAYVAYADNFAFHRGVSDTALAAGIRHRF